MIFHKILIIFIFYLGIVQAKLRVNSKEWICNTNNRCEPVPNGSSSNKVFNNQKNCRLSCGHFGSLWPRPTGETLISHDRVNFDLNNIGFNLTNSPENIKFMITEITHLFRENLEKDCKEFCNGSNKSNVTVNISIRSDNLKLSWDTDESYNLTIITTGTATNVDINGITIYGVRHGLETLTQLISSPSEIGMGLVIVSSAYIKDKPIYKHRGLLLDTARNFIPLPNIERTLDAMAASKLNIFHWHATDSHSFPLEIKRVPELQRFGAYSSKHTYSSADIKYIIQYAKYRGIRVIIEIDAPSHSGNGWQWGPESGLGNLAVCVNQQPWRSFCIQPPCGQLNPVNPNLYPILRDLFLDITELNPEEDIFHMGGDEVFFGCWNSTKEILEYLYMQGRDRSTLSFLKLWSEYQEKSLQIWDHVLDNRIHTKTFPFKKSPVIIWSSHLTDPEIIEQFLTKERYIIQTWVESSNPLVSQLLNKGYKIIASTKDAWYLDHGFWGVTKYYDWKKVYNNRLLRDPGVLGGETCMWSEFVDENSLDARIWPRTGAAAERLWADPETNAVQAESRFFAFRDRLVSRGVDADAIGPNWCNIHDGECQ